VFLCTLKIKFVLKVFFCKYDRKVTIKVTPNDPQRRFNGPPQATNGAQGQRLRDAPPAQWTPEGDEWSPNGRPKVSKAAEESPKTTEDWPKEPNGTKQNAILASFRSQYPHFNVPSGFSNINFKTSRS